MASQKPNLQREFHLTVLMHPRTGVDRLEPSCAQAHSRFFMQKRPLKILILNQSFWPDIVATAQHAHDLGKYLAEQGHSVTAVASRSLYGHSGPSLPKEETVDGIRVVRVAHNLFRGKQSVVKRALDYICFNLACLIRVLLLPRHDAVICLTTPPFIAFVGLALRFVKGSKLLLWTMDLYPDLPVAAGVIRRDGLSHRFFDRLDRFCLRRADHVVGLGRCMRERLRAKGVAEDHLTVIHPWSDPSEIRASQPSPTAAPIKKANPFRDEWDLGDRFVIQYSGNCGIGHDVQSLFSAMEAFKDRDDIRWVFVGDGLMRPSVVEFAERHGIKNIQFRPYQPRARLGDLLTMGDLHLVLMSPGFEGIILPSKFYGILAAARPTLFIGPEACEVAQVIHERGCGVVVSNGDATGLISAISDFITHPEHATAMGRAGRSALETHYSSQHACRMWLECLEKTCTMPKSQRDGKH